MGFRFRKSFKAGPFRATISKSGVSTSVGGKGARITKKANGNTSTSFSLPGTGINYTKEKTTHNTQAKTAKNTNNGVISNKTTSIILKILSIFIILGGLLISLISSVGVGFIGFGIILLIIGVIYSKKAKKENKSPH